jgi:3-hydroxybutyrate dehydrogenase
VVCPGFVRTPLVDKQIPEQAKTFGISEEEVVKNIMLKGTVDGEFTTVDDVANAVLFFAAFETNALTGHVSHRWSMPRATASRASAFPYRAASAVQSVRRQQARD